MTLTKYPSPWAAEAICIKITATFSKQVLTLFCGILFDVILANERCCRCWWVVFERDLYRGQKPRRCNFSCQLQNNVQLCLYRSARATTHFPSVSFELKCLRIRLSATKESFLHNPTWLNDGNTSPLAFDLIRIQFMISTTATLKLEIQKQIVTQKEKSLLSGKKTWPGAFPNKSQIYGNRLLQKREVFDQPFVFTFKKFINFLEPAICDSPSVWLVCLVRET